MDDPPDGTQHPTPPGYRPELVDSSTDLDSATDQPPPDYHPEQLLAPPVDQPPPTYTPSDLLNYHTDLQPRILSSPDSFTADYNKPIWAYHNRQSNGIGIFQILIGIACFVFQVLSLGLSRASGVSVIGHGIWSGSMFVLTGVFGIVAGKKRTTRSIKAFLVMCMVSAALTATLLSLGVFGAKKAGDLYKLFRCDYYFSIIYYSYEEYDNSNHSPCSSYRIVTALESSLAALAAIEALLALWGSVICFKALCCSKPPPESNEAELQFSYLQYLTDVQLLQMSLTPASANGERLNPPPYSPPVQPPAYTGPKEAQINSYC